MKLFVSIRIWCLQESDESRIPVPFPNDVTRDDFLHQFPGRLDIKSAARMHIAPITVEVWDAEPPEDTRTDWDVTQDAEFESLSGEVAVWSDGRESSFPLGESGLWNVRVHCAGRDDAARLARDGVVDGAESYLVQFWLRS